MALPLELVHDLKGVQKTLTATFIPMGESAVEVPCYTIDKDHLYAPRQFGLDYCKRNGIDYEDDTSLGHPAKFNKIATPRAYQVDFIDDLVSATESYYDFLARAYTGYGKTLCSLIAAARIGTTTLIVVDQENIKDQWLNALAEHFGMTVENGGVGIIQGKVCDYQRPVVVAMVQTLSRKVLNDEVYRYFGLLIVDEVHTCFPEGTKVDGTPIENYKVGDVVWSYSHVTNTKERKKITRVYRSEAQRMVRVYLSDGRTIDCTDNHPFYAGGHYIPAVSLSRGDVLQEYENGLQEDLCELLQGVPCTYPELSKNTLLGCMQGDKTGGPYEESVYGVLSLRGASNGNGAVPSQSVKQGKSILHPGMRAYRKAKIYVDKVEADVFGQPQYGRSVLGEDESTQSYGRYGDKSKGKSLNSIVGSQATDSRRKWTRAYNTSINASGGTGVGDGACGTYQDKRIQTLPLQVRYSTPYQKNSSRGGWSEPWGGKSTDSGRPQGRVLTVERVDCDSFQKCGSNEGLTEMQGSSTVYNIEVEGNHNYYAEGVLVHNCGSPVFSRILRQFHATYRIGLSATPKRKDGLQKMLDYNLGPVRVAADKEHDESSVYFITHPTVYSFYANISPKIGRILTEVSEDGSRNLLIAENTILLWETGRDVLILSDRIEQLQNLMALLYYMGVDEAETGLYADMEPHWRWAKNPTPARRPEGWVKNEESGQLEYTPISLQLISKKIPKARLEYVKKNARMFHATYGKCAKGFDEPRLRAGIDATPRGAAEQIHGRILREVNASKVAIWVTIVDDQNYRLVYGFGNRVADYVKSNAKIYKWCSDGELKECQAKGLRKQATARVKLLKSMEIRETSNGTNTLVTPASVKTQKKLHAKGTVAAIRSRHRASKEDS